MHEINKKRLENNTILNFLAELRDDEFKLKNLTIYTVFGGVLFVK